MIWKEYYSTNSTGIELLKPVALSSQRLTFGCTKAFYSFSALILQPTVLERLR